MNMSVNTCFVILTAAVTSATFAQQAPATPPSRGAGRGEAVTWITSGNPPADLLPNPVQHPTVALWPNGAPGSEGKTAGEKYRIEGDSLVLAGVNSPSITLYPAAKEKATGAGIIVAPSGAFSEIWITHEGYNVANWLNQHGIAAFVLKYRLQNDPGSGYTTEGHSLPDMQRAIRLVRSRAAEWGVDPNRVGVMGFSAGGALAGMAGSRYDDPVKNPVDDIDKLSAKPAFMALLYGTPFGGVMASQAKLPTNMPPVFLAAGGDDRISASYPEVYRKLKDAGASVELHIYAGVGHGFGIQMTNTLAVAGWPDQMRDWLFDLGLLKPKPL
jgi:endo-1,4-beta-xylanase